MKSLTQHIKADGSSLIPLEEKLRIGKDWKPDYDHEFEELMDVIKDIYKKSKAIKHPINNNAYDEAITFVINNKNESQKIINDIKNLFINYSDEYDYYADNKDDSVKMYFVYDCIYIGSVYRYLAIETVDDYKKIRFSKCAIDTLKSSDYKGMLPYEIIEKICTAVKIDF